MAIDLKKTDVVVIGLGAVGWCRRAAAGARRARSLVGLEAGNYWPHPAAIFAPDELRNNFPRLAASGRRRRITDNPDPPVRNASGALFAAISHSSHDERGSAGTSLHYCGAELAAQPLGLQWLVSETTRRYGASRCAQGGRRWRIGRSGSRSSSPITTMVEHDGRLCPARPGNCRRLCIDPRLATSSRGPRKRGYPMPPLR